MATRGGRKPGAIEMAGGMPPALSNQGAEWHAARLPAAAPQALADPAVFVERTGAENPFTGFTVAGGKGSIPAFVDVDGDGDLDLVAGGKAAALDYFRNNGDGTYAQLTGANNPFENIDLGSSATYSAPAAIDVDGDGDFDLVVGSNYGDLVVARNDGAGLWTQNGVLTGVDVASFSVPTAVDLDGDGDFDLVLGNIHGFLYGFRNDGGGDFAELTGPADPFPTLEVGNFSAPAFVDLDGDGDKDLVIGNYAGEVRGFENAGGAYTEVTDHPFDSFTFGSIPAFAFVDLDGDGDLDGVAGSADGQFRYFENQDAGAGVPVARPDSFTITESGTISNGNLFADNGNGADSDPDGPPVISAVNGGAGNVGTQVALASGALLTVNANGTFDYNPNGAFLATPTPGSGASNIPGRDSFTYTLAGGNTVTVSISLTGLDTNDTLRGTAGNDLLAGGLGDDWYFVENAGDAVVETAGQGNDRVFASVNYTLGAGASVETLSTSATAGTTAINLTGNELANVVQGNDGANVLDGKGGADTLAGRLGDDIYYVDNAGDRIQETAGQGNDRVFTSIGYTLAVGAAVETMSTTLHTGTAAINLNGNEFANAITGNDGANSLDGKAGADTLIGRLGNDYYYVDAAGDRVIEAAGQGNDRVFASASYALAAGAEVEVLSTTLDAGTAAINLTGNELANTLYGNAGANILDGKGGGDIMAGRLGDDVYYVDNAADRAVESAGQGNDRVLAGVSYVLAAGTSVETLSTSLNAGTNAINLTGNEIANIVIGNAGANILDGKAGADTLAGLAGDDFYHVDAAGDRILESAAQGADRLFASASYVLEAGVSVETLSTANNAGTAAIDLIGNELANTIYGNAGANVLDGKAGADVLVGSAGADSFAFTTAIGATNIDRIVDFSGADDTIRLDDAVFAGIGPLGALNANAFVTGAAAADANDRIVYNQATGQLFFDADGSGAGAAVLFATLQGAPAIGAGDFLVI